MPEIKDEQFKKEPIKTEPVIDPIQQRLDELQAPYRRKLEQMRQQKHEIKKPRHFNFEAKSFFDYGQINQMYLIGGLGTVVLYFLLKK